MSSVSKDSKPNSNLVHQESDVHTTRRLNLLFLLREFTAQENTRGEPAKGVEVRFGKLLEMSPSLLSQLKSSRNISDKVSEQIESHTGRPPGWLSEIHEVQETTPAQQAFLELAAAAWTAVNSKERRRLMQLAKNGFFK